MTHIIVTTSDELEFDKRVIENKE